MSTLQEEQKKQKGHHQFTIKEVKEVLDKFSRVNNAETYFKFSKLINWHLLLSIKKDPTVKCIEDIYRNSNLRKEAYRIANVLHIQHPDTWNKNKEAPLEWCSNFLKDCSEDTFFQKEFKLKFPNFIYKVKEPRELDTEKLSTSSIRSSEALQSEQDTIDPTVSGSQEQSSDKKFEFTIDKETLLDIEKLSRSSIRSSEAPQSEQDTIDPTVFGSQEQSSDKKFEFTIDKKALLKSLEQNCDVKSIKDICENTNVGEIAYNLIKEKQKPKSWKSNLPRKYQIDILKQCLAEHSELFEIQFPNVTLSTKTSETYDKFFKAPLKLQMDMKKPCTSSIKEVDEPQPKIQFIKETENQENKATKFSETPLLESQIEREKEKGIEPSLKSQVTDSQSAIEEFYEYEQNTFTWDECIEELEEENIELEKGQKKMKYDLYDLDDD